MYPSTMIRKLADTVDVMEDRFLDKNLDFWNWPNARELKTENGRLIEALAEMIVNAEEAGNQKRWPNAWRLSPVSNTAGKVRREVKRQKEARQKRVAG